MKFVRDVSQTPKLKYIKLITTYNNKSWVIREIRNFKNSIVGKAFLRKTLDDRYFSRMSQCGFSENIQLDISPECCNVAGAKISNHRI